MKIIVLARQVKIEDEVKCDFTGIEAAVRLKEQTDCHIFAMVLGYEKSGVQQVRDAVAMGCDSGRVIVCPELSALDAWACAKTFSQALKNEEYDLVLSGGFPTDADTVSIGLLTAEMAGLTFVSHVENITVDKEKNEEKESWYIEAGRRAEEKLQLLKVKTPCLMSALPHPEAPVYKTVKGINKAYSQSVETHYTDIAKDENKILVADSVKSEGRKRGNMLTAISTDEAVKAVIDKISANHLL